MSKQTARVLLCAVDSQHLHSNPAVYALQRAAERAIAGGAAIEQTLREYTINMPPGDVAADVYRIKPDILALSVYIWNSVYIRRLLADLRLLLPETTILLGGPEATARAARLLEEWPADGVCLGEGEGIWHDYLRAVGAGEPRPLLNGLLWRGEAGLPPAAAPPDMAALPFPYTDGDLARLAAARRVIYYESSRGCPYSCSFCASAEQPLRERPLELVLQELPRLAARPAQIKFVDRTFNADPCRAALILDKIRELYQPGLSWHFEIAPAGLPPQLIERFAAMPRDYIRLELGIQSLHPPTLAAIGRHGDNQRALQAIENLRAAANCHLHVDLIAGLPLETPDSFAAGFARLHQLSADYLQFGFLKLLPGSLLADRAADFGLTASPEPPYMILQTPDMPADHLFALQAAADAFDQLYHRDNFRRQALLAARLWPDGVLDFYIRAGEALRAHDGGLDYAARLKLLRTLLQPLDENAYEQAAADDIKAGRRQKPRRQT
ncbi:MAG: B12-binding domain-containing radical SAM protein [Bacillota bacterium]|nr:B12-binding domain-containing radical SAM protein [Bacillota bacterium]